MSKTRNIRHASIAAVGLLLAGLAPMGAQAKNEIRLPSGHQALAKSGASPRALARPSRSSAAGKGLEASGRRGLVIDKRQGMVVDHRRRVGSGGYKKPSAGLPAASSGQRSGYTRPSAGLPKPIGPNGYTRPSAGLPPPARPSSHYPTPGNGRPSHDHGGHGPSHHGH